MDKLLTNLVLTILSLQFSVRSVTSRNLTPEDARYRYAWVQVPRDREETYPIRRDPPPPPLPLEIEEVTTKTPLTVTASTDFLPRIMEILENITKSKTSSSPSGPINLNIIVVPIVNEERGRESLRKSEKLMADVEFARMAPKEADVIDLENSRPAEGTIPPQKCPAKHVWDSELGQCIRRAQGSSPFGSNRRRQIGSRNKFSPPAQNLLYE